MDPLTVSGLAYGRNLTGLYPLPPLSSGTVHLYLQGKQYLSTSLSAVKQDPASIDAVLRTDRVWVDRVKVRVAFQVRDKDGNVLTNQPTRVDVELSAPFSALHTRQERCRTVDTQKSWRYHLGDCSVTSLDAAWFIGTTRTSAVSVKLYSNANPSTVLATANLGSLVLSPQPSWWDQALRTATLGNGLSAPVGVESTGGVFVTLPTSPVYSGESFNVYMYADTATLSLNTWRVRIYFSSDYLQYDSFVQSGHFNSASPSPSSGEVSWLATGVKSTTVASDVTGSAIYLLQVRLSVKSSVAAGTFSGDSLGLYPRATELISGAAFVQDSNGQVFDSRDTAQTRGQLVVVSSSTAGIFAYPPSGVLANMAPLTGSTSSFALTVVQVSDDDRVATDSSPVSADVSCSTTVPSTVLSLDSCSILLGASQSTSAFAVVVSVSFGSHSAAPAFSIYSPQITSVSLGDDTLNRFLDSDGSAIVSSCASGGATAYPYQRTHATAYADGLDATTLVDFTVTDTAVAGVSSVSFDVIQGRRTGTTRVHLLGREGSTPSAQLTVSDTTVTVLMLVARVVTSAEWIASGHPSSQYAFGEIVTASVLLSNSMTAEGDSGYMFSRVVWSDGSEQDIGNGPTVTIDEVDLEVESTNVATTAPSGGGESFWRVGVAVGAVKECVQSAFAVWRVCGATVASGQLPLFLNMPLPIGAGVTIDQDRLTPPSDDARFSPIGLPVSSGLTVIVEFDDESNRDLSIDSRVAYSTPDTACADVSTGASSNVLTMTFMSVCNSVLVVATVHLGDITFAINATRPVVYMERLTLSFSGYPAVGVNDQLTVTTLGLIPCLTSTYFHATAAVHAFLSDSSTTAYDVTGQSSFQSLAPDVIFVSSVTSTRMQGRSAGSSVILASFGSKTMTTATLTVQNAVLDVASELSWTVPTVDANTLQMGDSRASQVQLTYSSGLRHTDMASGMYSEWIDVSSIVFFSSAQPSSLSVSPEGGLTLHDNYQTAVSLAAQLACESDISASSSRFANLAAAPMDVDFGSLSGLQFPHTPGSSYLDIAVHVTPASARS